MTFAYKSLITFGNLKSEQILIKINKEMDGIHGKERHNILLEVSDVILSLIIYIFEIRLDDVS